MSANPFDQASRSAAWLDPVLFLCWLLKIRPDLLRFERWLDTRSLPVPGHPERTCDTVAHVLDVLRGLIPWAIVVEFQLGPDPLMFGRMLEYLGRLWCEKKPSAERGDRFQIGAVVVNLTGRGQCSRTMDWPEANVRTTLQVIDRNLCDEDAAATLTAIAVGEVTRAVLPFIPLMHGGDDPGIIQQWLTAALAEPDSHLRSEYGSLAVVLAEAGDRQDVWKQALHGWNMKQSKQVLEWQAEAKVEERQDAVLELLEMRFGPLPPDLITAIRAVAARSEVQQLFRLAAQAASLPDFRQQSQL